MECRNCEIALNLEDLFCSGCGAKIVKERITAKKLKQDFFIDVFGWDTLYIRTFKELVINPEYVLVAYFRGVRKRYMQPFTFMMIGVTLAVFMSNLLKDSYLATISEAMTNNTLQDQLFAQIQELVPEEKRLEIGSETYQKELDIFKARQYAITYRMYDLMIQYLTLVLLLALPYYSYLSYRVFKKEHYNFGEHIVLNAYLFGLWMLFQPVLLAASTFIYPGFYFLSFPIGFVLYVRTYKRLLNWKWQKMIRKVIKFIFLLIVFGIVIGFISGIAGFFAGRYLN